MSLSSKSDAAEPADTNVTFAPPPPILHTPGTSSQALPAASAQSCEAIARAPPLFPGNPPPQLVVCGGNHNGMASRPVLDREQTRKAVSALMKYIGKEKAEAKELFDDDEFLYLVRSGYNKAESVHRYFSS